MWKKHCEEYKRKDKGSNLHKHDVECHNEVEQQYFARVMTKKISLLTLSMREAVLQSYQKPELSLDDRIEMGRRAGLVRIQRASCDTGTIHY